MYLILEFKACIIDTYDSDLYQEFSNLLENIQNEDEMVETIQSKSFLKKKCYVDGK